jgi:hypothetical protein
MYGLLRRLSWVALVSAALNNAQATPWDDLRGGLFNEAHHTFSKEAEAAGKADQRGLRFGEAVALLNIQPRTQSNIDKAYALLEDVRTAAPGDDLGIESRYLQGRIEQVQRSTPDPVKAEAIFSELVQQHPAHPIGQRARVKLAVLRLYAKTDAAERRRRYDDFTSGAGELSDPGAKVQMHLLLADVAQRFKYGNEEELAHMLAADQVGVIKRSLQVQVLVRVGDLARLTGKNAMARTYYTRFLEQFPRTDRRSTIEGYLAALN